MTSVYAPSSSTPDTSKRPTIAVRSSAAETRNALCQAQYVPATRSRHGSLVSSVSHEREPEVDLLLAEDLDRLVELLDECGRGAIAGRWQRRFQPTSRIHLCCE
jgi:hypothetical protein